MTKFFLGEAVREIQEIESFAELKTAQLKEGGVALKGKRLLVDFFSPTTLECRATQDSDNVLIECWVRSGKQEWPLASADYVHCADRSWAVFGQFLRVFSDNFANRRLPRLIKRPEQLLSLDEARDFVSDCEEWELPIVGDLKLGLGDDLELPLLQLTDAYGAFANLSDKGWEDDLLAAGYQRKFMDASDYYCPMDRVRTVLLGLLDSGWQIEDALGRSIEVIELGELRIEQEGDYLQIKGAIKHGEASLPLEAATRREPFLAIGEGKVGLLKDDRPLKQLLSAGEITSDGLRLRRSRAGLLADESLPLKPDNSWQRLVASVPEQKRLGKHFNGSLRPYQQQGVNWLSFLEEQGLGALLADDMGLGKTVQLLAWLSTRQASEPVVVVAPMSLLFHWRREAERFLPGWPVRVHHGSERGLLGQPEGLVLTSYGTLRRDGDQFEAVCWRAVVLDEAQRIKNAQTQVAQAVYRLPAQFRVALSGTPVENHLGELWSQFHFLLADLFGSEAEFAALDMEQLRRRLKPYLLRRRKQDVALELPEKIELESWVQMSSEQEALYAQLLQQFKQGVLRKVAIDGLAKHRMEVFELILRLRQVCCHPLLMGEEAASGKLQALLNDIDTAMAEGAQVLVYSQFTSFLKLLGRELSHPHSYLDGTTRDREAIVDAFQSGQSRLLLASLKAGGVGLNLTAADYVLIAEPWWNAAAEQQAIDRAHRIGRENPVIARRYLTANSIEARMHELKAQKTALVDALLDGASDVPQGLATEDIEFLCS